MAKVKIRNTGVLKKRLKDKIDAYKNDAEEMNLVAKTMQTQYRFNVREGFDAQGKDLPPLASSTIKQRKYLIKNNKTRKGVSASKSNLTITGELVEKITIVASQFGRFLLQFNGTHKRYLNKEKNPIGKKETSISDIASYLYDKGFNLFGFPERKKGFVAKFVARRFKAFLRRK